MYSPRKHLQTPSDFKFPHKPYEIQKDLMVNLYNVLEYKKIGIFESPTGTGKSLTLTCGALRWLEDHNDLVHMDLQQRINETELEIKRLEAESAKTTDWITTQFATKQQRDELFDMRTLENSLREHQQRLADLQERSKGLQIQKKQRQLHKRSKVSESNELENSEIALELDDDGDDNEENETTNENLEKYREVQIFFCSRTHSQLAQVLREVKRTEYGKHTRCVSMASRQQLCVNPAVKCLPSVGLINERCLDMARSNAKGKSDLKKPTNGNSCKCSYKNPNSLQDLCDTVLTDIHDIEDLVASAEDLKACPYYATRTAVSSSMAQLVMLPYQMLLHRRTRQQSGIDLKGSIVIIDEAHNLLDTISQLHSCELTLQQLQAAQEQIVAYKMRYSKRFNAANLLRINQLLFVVKRLTKLLQTPSENSMENVSILTKTRVLPAYQVAAQGDFFNIDLFQLINFCERNRFAQKLQGFAKYNVDNEKNALVKDKENGKGTGATKQMLQRLQDEAKLREKPKAKVKVLQESSQSQSSEDQKETKENKKRLISKSSPIHPLLAFLEALTEKAEDGRVFINPGPQNPSFKYVVLNPGNHFKDILTEARAIIIAGGTMQPINELTEQLFSSCPDRIEKHFYDHVVPTTAVSAFVVQRGPKGGKLNFNFTSRASKETLAELLMILQNLCQVIPAGLVCFFPSYDYLDLVFKELMNSEGIRKNIESRKQIFREPRTNSNTSETKGTPTTQSVEQMLEDYATSIRLGRVSGRGALLFSVVGGKLSEGLNFADDLGRGVIVVGMPYANSQSSELQERMRYLDATLFSGAGSEYYENLCMKAINQCIGRSVRHIRDYASVFLLDERYTKEHIRNKLPKWINRNLQMPPSFGLVQAMTAKFFKDKREKSELND